MSDIIQHKRSDVSGNEPQAAEMALGEIAINTHDGHMFIERSDASIVCINGRRLVTKTADHTLEARDHDALIVAATDATIDIRIPTHAVAPLRVGSIIPLIRRGSGLVEVFASAGVTLRAASGTILSDEFVPAYLMKIGMNEWVLYGSVDIASNLSGIMAYTLSVNLLTNTLPTGMRLIRPSSAMCVGPDGLLRYAPENRLLRSQTFTTTWVASRIDTSTNGLNAANLFAAPDGTTTAYRLLADTQASNHRVYQASLSSQGMAQSRMTFSCHLKADTSNFAAIGIGNQNESRVARQIVDLSDGSIESAHYNGGGNAPTIESMTATPLTGGWYRVAMTVSTNWIDSNDNNYSVWVHVCDNASSLVTAASSGAAVFIWGAQLEAGPILTEYAETQASAYYGPLFDHSFTGEPRGLYIDQQVTNLARPAWYGFNCYNTQKPGGAGYETMVPDTGIDGLPDSARTTTLTGGTGGSGFLDARVGENATGNGVYTLTAGETYTLSFYWKSSRSFNSRIWNNATNATITPDETVDEPGPNGFTRRRITYTVPAGASSITHAWAYGSGYNTGDTFTLCAAQIESGPIASPFVPTRTASVTRSVDRVEYDSDSLPVWFTSNTYTLLARYEMSQPATFIDSTTDRYAGSFGSGTGAGNPHVYVTASYRTSTTGNAGRWPRVFDTSNTDLNASASLTPTAAANIALVFAMSSNDSRIRFAGNAVTDTVSTPIDGVANFTRFSVGNNTSFGTNARALRGRMQRLIYWPSRLTNAQMDGLVP